MTYYQSVRHLLAHRTRGFDYIFKFLTRTEHPLIVETGCARYMDNFHGDGQSSLLFDHYVEENGGQFLTVDISEESCNYCRSKIISSRSSVYQGDSISYLKQINDTCLAQGRQIDVLYLDSMDCSFTDRKLTKKSAKHHLFELLAIKPSLKKDCLICVDDNWSEVVHQMIPEEIVAEKNHFRRAGKGQYIAEYMQKLGNFPVYDHYQMIWKNC